MDRIVRLIAAVIPALIATTLWADDLETQHALDVAVPLAQGLTLTLHSRIRTQPLRLGLYQIRGGPILSWDARPRLTLLGGYYHSEEERVSNREYAGTHRLFGGAEARVAQGRRWYIEERVVVERFVPSQSADYTRYRLRSRLGGQGIVAPITDHEFFFDSNGWRGNRHSVGVRWSCAPGVQIDAGYLFEHRRPDTGSDRHMLLTSIRFRASRGH